MRIRVADAADKQAINELRRQVKLVHAAGRPDFFTEDFDQASADYLNVLFMRENGEILVAEQEDGIVGLACMEYVDRPGTPYRLPAKHCHIEEFVVDEHHRRQGIGKTLFDFVKRRAAKRGFFRIELGMWEFNEGALKFYESMGFRTFKRQLEYCAAEEE